MRKSVFNFFASLSIFYGASMAPSLADKQYPTTIVAPTGSPVSITKCEAWARDIHVGSMGFNASNPNMLSDIGISFVNNSDKSITALRLEVTSYDIANAPIELPMQLDTDANRSADRMTVPARASFDLLGPRSWHPRYNIFQNADHVSCVVTVVRFADGSVWTPSSSTAAQTKSAMSDTYPAGSQPSLTPGQENLAFRFSIPSKYYPTSLVTATNSPVALTECRATSRDLRYKTQAVPNALITFGIVVVNKSTKAITALRLSVISFDSFNGVLGSAQLDTKANSAAGNMKLDPGSSLELLDAHSWLARNAFPNRDHIACEVTSARFGDGSIWRAPSPAP
jgi:hypothetical protein